MKHAEKMQEETTVGNTPKKVSLNKSDIDDLMKMMLQDFIDISVRYSFSEESLGRVIAPILSNELSKQHPVQVYIDMDRKLKYLGLSEYLPKELDVTAATALLLYHGEEIGFPSGRMPALKSLLHSFREDRNELPAHSTGNETEYEVFEWGVITLGHMSRFLQKVYSSELFDEASRSEYRRKYRNKIKQTKCTLELDYRAYLQEINESQELDILLRKVLDSSNPMGFHEVGNEFLRSSSSRYDLSKYIAWVKKSAKAGIDSAQEMLAGWYYEGSMLAGIEKDWSRALELYETMGEVSPPTAIRIASLYVNGVSPEHTRDEGLQLIEKYKEKWEVGVMERDDGATEYYWIPKNRRYGELHDDMDKL